MLYYLRHLYEPGDWRLVFNLFRYVTFRAAAAAATAFIVTAAVMPLLIRRLRARGVVEQEEDRSEKLAELKRGKRRTPTMGGIGILAGVLAAALLWGDVANRYLLVSLVTGLAMGVLGFIDDLMKLPGRPRRGMSGRWKLLVQAAVASAVGLFFVFGGEGPFSATRLAVPFVKPGIFAPELGVAYVLVVVFLVVGTSNSVNITDGLDGLAGGCTAVAALVYAALVYVAGHAALAGYLNLPFVRGAGEVTIVCAALGGAVLGFLWFNASPAQIFMGDTGSLAIGGILGVAACVAKQEILLALVGGVFVAEAGSVLIQVWSMKLRAKRVFLCAPLHHHYQLKGWSDDKIVIRFWIVGVICALMSVATLKIR